MSTEVAVHRPASLVEKFASKYSIEPNKLMDILKATCFKVKDTVVTNEQMAALLVVADQYGLNPFTKEIFAFPDKQNGIVPVVGVDGWTRIANDHPQMDGVEFRQSEEMVTLADAQPCPKWMEVVIYRKDRAHPTVIREYIDEVYRTLGIYKDGNKMKPGPWQTHTKRFLRWKTLIQGYRVAFGFAGIYDEDEAERIVEAVQVREVLVEQPIAIKETKTQGGITATLPAEHMDAKVIEGTTKPIEGTATRVDEGFAPTIADVKLLLEAGDVAGAKDMARSLPAGEVEAADLAIAEHIAGGKEPTKPMLDGQKRILFARLKSSGKTKEDLEKHMGVAFDAMTSADFTKAQSWCMS